MARDRIEGFKQTNKLVYIRKFYTAENGPNVATKMPNMLAKNWQWLFAYLFTNARAPPPPRRGFAAELEDARREHEIVRRAR